MFSNLDLKFELLSLPPHIWFERWPGVYHRWICWLHRLIPWQPRHRQAESPDMEFTQVACGAAHTCALSIAACQKAFMSKNDEAWWRLLMTSSVVRGAKSHIIICWLYLIVWLVFLPTCCFKDGLPHPFPPFQDGRIFCWGSDEHSRSSGAPDGRFVSIAASGGHSCAPKKSGEALCWGFNVA